MPDPVCRMPVDPATATTVTWAGTSYSFCSSLCVRRFRESPELYAASLREGFRSPASRTIAFFSVEIAVHSRGPAHSGLGVLAGDMLRSCADLDIPIVALTLLAHHGQPRQVVDADGRQSEPPTAWGPGKDSKRLAVTADVEIEGRRVRVGAWQFDVQGARGYLVPIYFLDTDFPENAAADRRLSGAAYGGDARDRLAQAIVLGIGGRRILRALGYASIEKLHLHEGHAALAAWDLLRELGTDFGAARARCVLTTHAPLATGRDRFPLELVSRLLGPGAVDEPLRMLAGSDELDMTRLALDLSGVANGAARPSDVTEEVLLGYAIHHVTDGVHSRTWTFPKLRALFDLLIPGWDEDPALLRHALRLPSDELWRAHSAAKEALLALVEARTGVRLHPLGLLIGSGGDASAHAWADLLLADLARLERIELGAGDIHLLFGGKPSPGDEESERAIERIVDASSKAAVRVVYVPDYDLEAASVFVAGSDVWLVPPRAVGTSGMKAAHNGVPTLSAREGWWIEGHVEGATGWSAAGARELYDKLEGLVVPAYRDRDHWTSIMKHVIALNASYFNTHRMVQQYAARAYLPISHVPAAR